MRVLGLVFLYQDNETGLEKRPRNGLYLWRAGRNRPIILVKFSISNTVHYCGGGDYTPLATACHLRQSIEPAYLFWHCKWKS